MSLPNIWSKWGQEHVNFFVSKYVHLCTKFYSRTSQSSLVYTNHIIILLFQEKERVLFTSRVADCFRDFTFYNWFRLFMVFPHRIQKAGSHKTIPTCLYRLFLAASLIFITSTISYILFTNTFYFTAAENELKTLSNSCSWPIRHALIVARKHLC